MYGNQHPNPHVVQASAVAVIKTKLRSHESNTAVRKQINRMHNVRVTRVIGKNTYFKGEFL